MLKISTGKVKSPYRMVIYGIEGIGKSTLANMFPGSLFLDLENGSKFLNTARVDDINSYPEFNSTLLEIQNHRTQYTQFQNLVIDTGDKLEEMISQTVCSRNKKENLVDVGWGNGFKAVKEEWKSLLDRLNIFQKATGMNITLICHANLRKIEEPENSGSYDHWELRCNLGGDYIKAWCDYLWFYKYQSEVIEGDDKKGTKNKITGGKRVICTGHTVYYDAKSRCKLEPIIQVNKENVEELVQYIMSQTPDATEAPAPAVTPAPAVISAQPAVSAAQAAELGGFFTGPAPQPAPEVKEAPKTAVKNFRNYYDQLTNVMCINGVKESEIVRLAVIKKMVPEGTEFGNLNEASCKRFVDSWEKIIKVIHTLRERGEL